MLYKMSELSIQPLIVVSVLPHAS